MNMTDLERLRCTCDFLDEKYKKDRKAASDDPIRLKFIKETWKANKQAFAAAIRILESRAKKTIYIAGPITGVEDYQRNFNQAENELIVKGYTVLNPAKLPPNLSYEQYARIDFALIDAADAVVMLPKWEESQGACLEFEYCRYIGKPVYFSAAILPPKEADA